MTTSPLNKIFVLLAIGCLQSPLLANQSDASYRQFLSGVPCTEEQRAKIRFAVEPLVQSPGGAAFSDIRYKIYNGTDHKIAGLLLAVTFKNPDSGKVETLDIFSDFSLVPASCGFGEACFYYPNLAVLESKITLKEVRLVDPKG